jgi:hypothetical protein
LPEQTKFVADSYNKITSKSANQFCRLKRTLTESEVKSQTKAFLCLFFSLPDDINLSHSRGIIINAILSDSCGVKYRRAKKNCNNKFLLHFPLVSFVV